MDSGPSREFVPLIFLLTRSILDRLTAHAQGAYPRECCGFLLGQDFDGELMVDDVMPAGNVASDKGRYEIAPESVLLAERSALERGLSILGVYHSHPDGDRTPSDTDRREGIPNLPHVIMSIESTGKCDASAWMLTENGRFAIVGIAELGE
jgi:proteasome lid subunit RPN8/RPN11